MSWLTRLRLQTRISLLVVLGLVLIFAVMAWESTHALQTATDMALQERLTLARTLALYLDEELERMVNRLAQVATLPAFNLGDGDMEPEKAELRSLYRSQEFSYVFLLDKEGLVLWSEPYLADVVGRQRLECPYAQDTLRTGHPAIACLAHTLTPENPVVAPVVPIRNREGVVAGLLGGAIDPSSPILAHVLQGVAQGRTGYTQLVDENGLVLAHTEGRDISQRSEHAAPFIPLVKEKEATVAVYTVTEEGKGTFREVIAFAPLSTAPWGVAVEQGEAELLAPALALRRQMLLFAGIALASALLLVWVTTRSVVEPVHRLVAASRRIAAGDLATPVPPLGEDEIGELGQAFDEMRARLARWGEELEQKVKERARELSILYTIDRATAQSLELEKVLNDAVEATLDALEIEAGGIYLLEPGGEAMTLRAHRGLSEEFVATVQCIRLGEGISGQAAAEGRPVVLEAADYPTERLAPLVANEGFQTLASTPLLSAGKPVGALNLGARRPRAFPSEELDMLAAIGQQLGVAVEKARLYERERRLVTYLQHLNQATARANANLQLGTLAQAVTETLVSKFGAAFARLWAVDEAGENLVLRASAGLYTRLDGKRAKVPIATDPRKLGVIARAHQPLITNTVLQDPEFDREWAEREGLVAFAGYPVVLGERLLGVLALFSRQPLDEEMLDVLGAFVNQVAVAIENARLFEAEQRRVARLIGIVQLGAELATLPQEEAMLATLVTRAATLLESATCTVMLVDEAANEAILAAQTGLPEGTPPDLRVPLTLPVIRRSLETGEPIILADIDRDAPEMRRILVRQDIRAFFAYPMWREGHTVGYITLSNLTPRTPSAQEIAACQLLAELAAGALQNARLFRERTRRLAELSALFEVSGALRDATTVGEILPIILDKTVEVLQADAGALFRVDEGTGQLVAQAARGRLEGLLGLRLGMTEGVCGYVIQTCAAYPFADLASDPYTGDRVRPLVAGVQGGLCVPLLTGETLVGTLIIGNEEPRTFNDDEVRLLTAIADIAASAIHRASLFEELQARVRELTTVYQVGKAITGTLRIQNVLDFIVSTASKTLHAEDSFVFLWNEREERLVKRAAVVWLPGERIGQAKYQLGEGLAGWVFLEGRPTNVPNLAADPRWKREPEHEAVLPSGAANNALVVPLVVGTRALGVLGVVNKVGAPSFSSADESLLTALAAHMAIAIDNARLYESVRGLSVATIRSLATAIDARDPYTKGHSEQVARLSVLIAQRLGWTGPDLELLEFAALLHDVGKIGIPDAVLKKTEPLSPEEWDIIRLHPYHSAQIVKPVEPLGRIIPWIYHHQERWDGTGYPDRLKGEQIPLPSRIIAVADAFNAMTTDRPYHKALGQDEAIEELRRCAGAQFDPQVVEAFLEVVNQRDSEVTSD